VQVSIGNPASPIVSSWTFKTALGEISSALSTVNVSWLQDAKNWFREPLDIAGQSGTLSEGEIALAATLYAVNEVFSGVGA
jgi:hypothetical protein